MVSMNLFKFPHIDSVITSNAVNAIIA